MNAKKIMGAVLVALLAAALLVGAGAALPAFDGKTVFVYQEVNGLSGEWTNGVNSITALTGTNGGYFSGANIVEGKYTQGSGDNEATIYVKYPTVTVSGVANGNTPASAYLFIGGNLYTGTNDVEVDIKSPAYGTLSFVAYVTKPNGEELEITTADPSNLETYLEGEPAEGEYSIRAKFNTNGFAVGTPVTALITKPVTFTVVDSDKATIATSVDQILKGDAFKVTVTGEPGVTYYISVDKNAFENPTSIYFTKSFAFNGVDKDVFDFVMPNSGSVEFTLAAKVATADDSEKIILSKLDEENKMKTLGSVTVKFTKGTITAEADATSYFVGDKITITGTNKAGTIVGYTIKGTNFEYTKKNLANDDEEFELEIETATISNQKENFGGKKLDVGTYTVTIYVDDMDKPSAKAAVAVALKQPFISIVSAPEVIVQDTDAEFVINAEATNKGIAYYIFGTNYFIFNKKADADEDTTNQFTVKLDKATTKNMSAGQYFMVIQHPMYDTFFNIMANESTFYLNTTADASNANGDKLFSFDIRQTANAAQALCDNLDSQTIDDMYVKYSFFVVGEDESFTISEIPSQVAKGSTFTVSGVSTSNAGDFVTVEMISTAFAAVPKETVGSASFIVLTTQIADDGTWEVTFDTSDLNVDEYSLKVAVTTDGADKTWKNVEINVVEAADKPDTPVTPPADDEPGQDEPVAPETPGFGALAALAGLGAVAVLLLRRE